MKIHFWSIGKEHEPYIQQGVEIFTQRISHYYSIEWKIIASAKKNLPEEELKKYEGEAVLKLLQPNDFLILLDGKGKQMTSEQLAALLTTKANQGTKNLVFLIGGAFGVDNRISGRADYRWSLSNLIFPHQLVRLILAEQVYRACTIIRNEKYHHS